MAPPELVQQLNSCAAAAYADIGEGQNKMWVCSFAVKLALESTCAVSAAAGV